MTKIVTVLGASGNIGKLLVPYLLNQGYTVKAVGRHKPDFIHPNVINLEVDYNSLDQLVEVTRETQAIYMLIGLEYKSSIWEKEWPPLTERLIKAAKASQSKLIFFDNVYSYGLVDGKMLEETNMNPQTRKGKVRKIVDELLLEAIKSGEIKGVIAKSADFYGPGISTSIMGDRFFNLILTKNTIEVFGNPKKIHNYTYVKDIPVALEKLASSNFNGNIHLPTAQAITGNELKLLLEQITGKTLKLTNLSQRMAWWLGLFMPILRELHEMMYQTENNYDFDSSKILSLFPDLKVTPYGAGLLETLNWYQAHLNSKN